MEISKLSRFVTSFFFLACFVSVDEMRHNVNGILL